MEQKIFAIVKKIREMYRYDKTYKALLCRTPRLCIKFDEDETEIILSRIIWDDGYDSIHATCTGIDFEPEKAQGKELITYDSWDALLAL